MKKIELIAEIGTNHNGDFDEAIKLIDLASKAKIDTVKFQVYESKDIVSPLVKTSMYGEKYVAIQSKYKYWKDYIDEKLITPAGWLRELVQYSESKGLDVVATPHSMKLAEECLKSGIKKLKIASMDCNYYPFIEDLCSLNTPLLLSTGMADRYEIMKSVELILQNNIDLTLFHCTSSYPTKYGEANLEFLKFLSLLNPTKLGLSDHAENNDLVLMSIPYGISVVEKHITSNKSQPGPDHSFALDFEGMVDWRNKTDNGLLALGSSKKELSISELNNRVIARRKPILSKEMKKGNILSKSEIYYSRPECTENGIIGIDELEFFIGMPFTMDVAPNQVLKRKFFL